MKRMNVLLVLLLAPPVACAEGRLFYSPTQRAGLEQARQHHVTEHDAARKPRDSLLTYNGFVMRSDGRNTQWINGRSVAGAAAVPRYRGIALKPGQTEANGRIYDPHQLIRESTP